MNWTSAFQLATAIIASLGGGAALVLAFANYLGKLWADRALEKEKHKYAEILETAKSNLERTTKRYQVELDSLTLVHKLRTTEEFSRLGQLWRHMAILQNAFAGAAGTGIVMVPKDAAERSAYKVKLRQEYETALFDARQFFLEQKLFIPASIADCAQATINAPTKEKMFYDLFAGDYEPSTSRIYREELPAIQNTFAEGMTRLEGLMRDHIEGAKLK
jgi:hypothetical protein